MSQNFKGLRIGIFYKGSQPEYAGINMMCMPHVWIPNISETPNLE